MQDRSRHQHGTACSSCSSSDTPVSEVPIAVAVVEERKGERPKASALAGCSCRAHCRGGAGRSCTRRICCSAPAATLRTRSCAWHCDQQYCTVAAPSRACRRIRRPSRCAAGKGGHDSPQTSMFAQRTVTTTFKIVSARPPFPIPAARRPRTRPVVAAEQSVSTAPVFLIDDELSSPPLPPLASEHRCRCQGRRFTEGFTQRKRQGQSGRCRQPCGTQHAKINIPPVVRSATLGCWDGVRGDSHSRCMGSGEQSEGGPRVTGWLQRVCCLPRRRFPALASG